MINSNYHEVENFPSNEKCPLCLKDFKIGKSIVSHHKDDLHPIHRKCFYKYICDLEKNFQSRVSCPSCKQEFKLVDIKEFLLPPPAYIHTARVLLSFTAALCGGLLGGYITPSHSTAIITVLLCKINFQNLTEEHKKDAKYLAKLALSILSASIAYYDKGSLKNINKIMLGMHLAIFLAASTQKVFNDALKFIPKAYLPSIQ